MRGFPTELHDCKINNRISFSTSWYILVFLTLTCYVFQCKIIYLYEIFFISDLPLSVLSKFLLLSLDRYHDRWTISPQGYDPHSSQCFGTDIGYYAYSLLKLTVSNNVINIKTKVPLFVWGRLPTGASQEKRKEANRSFNFTFICIDDVLSLNNSRLGDFVDRIYPTELETKDTRDRIASCLDLYIEIDTEGRLRTKLYDKRDDFKFSIYM